MLELALRKFAHRNKSSTIVDDGRSLVLADGDVLLRLMDGKYFEVVTPSTKLSISADGKDVQCNGDRITVVWEMGVLKVFRGKDGKIRVYFGEVGKA